MKVAFVVQRYGQEVMGGSELHCRLLAERLADRGYDCTVYTTTAQDYVTWANVYPAGETILNGVVIRRYPVEKPREIVAFNKFSDWIFFHPHTREDELRWMEEQGPFSPALVEAVGAAEGEHDRFVFMTYLYYNTYWGLQAIRKPKILVPTAHDEPALHLGIMKEVFDRPAAFMFNTEAEKAMLGRYFSFAGKYQETVGVGTDIPEKPKLTPFDAAYADLEPYLLYAGRIEPGKGCAELFEAFLWVGPRLPELNLVLIGNLLMSLPAHPRIRYRGFVSAGEKDAAMARAAATVHPSRLESLCMAALESMAAQTPILVQAATEPLKQHCLAGNGGLTYATAAEFGLAAELLVRDRRLRAILGRNGRDYVRRNYSWDRVLEKYDAVFAAM
jgi:glycosyltransferase involved in cell wall biosynthesis